MKELLLSIKKLQAAFKVNSQTAHILHGIDIDINKEEIVGLLGSSGSGKTLTGLSILKLAPSNCEIKGEVLFENKNILTLTKNKITNIRGAKISMIFQDSLSSLDPLFNIHNQISEILRMHTTISPKDYKIHILELLKAAGIQKEERILSSYPHQLSGGMRQRVMIAQAIACKPSLIIADEPTSSLDVTIQAQIIDLFKKLRSELKLAMLFITHDNLLLKNIADRICVIYDGIIVENKTVSEIFNNPEHFYTKQLLEAVQ